MSWPFCGTNSMTNPVFCDANQPPSSMSSMSRSKFDQGSMLWRPDQVLLDSTLFWEVSSGDVWCWQAPGSTYLPISVLEWSQLMPKQRRRGAMTC